MFADPSESCFFCERFFEHRSAVHECAVAEFADDISNPVREALQPLPDDLVVVATQGVAGHISKTVMIEQFRGLLLRDGEVVHAHRDDAQCAGHEFGRS